MKIQGKVLRGNEAIYGAKVFISDETGKLLDTKMAAVTDSDGKYSISAPLVTENGVQVLDTTKYITMTNNFPTAKITKNLEREKTQYDFDVDFAGKEQQIQEVTVTAKRTKKDTKSITAGDKKKSYIWLIPIAIGLATIGGILLYRKYKKK